MDVDTCNNSLVSLAIVYVNQSSELTIVLQILKLYRARHSLSSVNNYFKSNVSVNVPMEQIL